MNKKFYITTAIPYVNAAPHIGHALELVQTDAIARYHRLLGEKVRFLSGTDENALKNVQAAEEKGISVQDLVEKNSDKFFEVTKKLNILLDDFIRTTEKRHFDGASALWSACKNEDIYKKSYQGLYCVGCETFYVEKDLVDGLCPEHKKAPELVSEENYFFRLSNYQKYLEDLIETDKLKIVPEFRKNEVLAFIKGGLEDFSISRSVKRAKGWGIPVPGDNSQIIYVWFDALTNYITALNWQNNDVLFTENWPADLQVIGKGITRFHAIYWPAMLKSANIEPPKSIFIHGYVTAEGEKISKSIGNVIDPIEYVDKYGVDAVRYYLLKEIPAYNDGDFSQKRFVEVYNSELANNFGNLVSRLAKLAEGLTQPFKWSIVDNNDPIAQQIKIAYDKYKFEEVISTVNKEYIDFINSELNKTAPWKLEAGSKERNKILLNFISKLLEGCAFLEPIIPDTINKIKAIFTGVIKPVEVPLFSRIKEEIKTVEEKILSNRSYWVDEQAKEVGVKFQVAEIYGVTIKKKNPELEKTKKNIAELVNKTDYTNDLILEGYKKLFENVGAKNVLSSPDSLIRLVKDKGALPTVNTVVDAYNIKSIETKLVISAHDLDKLKGDIRIVTTTGKEVFYPLGSTVGENLPINEWGAVDDGHILCRLNCKQSELSKVIPMTKNLLIYVQGSVATSNEYLQKSLKEICEYIVKYNGGKYVILKEK